MAKDRVVIIHNHLFKNAGTTIDFALQRNLGANFIDHWDDDNMKKGVKYLGPYLSDNSHIKALSTHSLTLPLPSLEGVFLPMIMMLRHPIERALSVYQFERKQTESDTVGAVFARDHDLKQYIQWRICQSISNTVKNFYMCRSIPRREKPNTPYNNIDFERACDFLKNVEMLGFVDRFDESMVLFESFLKEYFPDLDMAYIPQNVNQGFQPIEKRLEILKNGLGGDLYHAFVNCNKNDLALYETARSNFEKRIESFPNFESKLKNFRDRCSALR